MARCATLLALLLGVAVADDLEPAKPSPRAARLRDRAQALWEEAAPVWERARKHLPVPAAEAVATLRQLEEAVAVFEKALAIEWHREANATLATAVRAWYAIRELRPDPVAGGEEAAAKATKEREKRRRERLREVRRFIQDYGRARRFESQYQRCPRCDGRKYLYHTFGKEKRPCPTCRTEGRLPVRQGIIRARWRFHSPLYRAHARSTRDVTRALEAAARSPERLAPFVRGVAVDEIEDHDLWVRVKVTERTFTEPGRKRTVKTKKTYVLYRVGEVWYLYFPRHDADLVQPDAQD
ncbi:MAG: hypothetical protein ACYTEZ_18920 [Planctomycetota bacterium]